MAGQTTASPDLGRALIIRESGTATLGDAMKRLDERDEGGVWTGIANSPRRSEWWSRGVSTHSPSGGDVVSMIRGAEAKAVALSDESVFEVRGFNGTHEFRWHHTGEGSGRLVILALADQPPSDDGAPSGWELPVAASSWLLWGQRTGGIIEDPLVPGVFWHRFSAARIGSYWVPVPGGDPTDPPNTHLRVNVSTVVTHDRHGNASVTDEILTGFTWGKEAIA